MIESQYGDKTFPSFVKWLVGWKVEMKFKRPFVSDKEFFYWFAGGS